MSFKMPLKVNKLADLKAKAYIKLAAMLLRNKLKDGDTVPYMLVLNHKYADLDEAKSQKIPLFLVGNFDSSWKDFHKNKLDGGKLQKAFTVQGMCAKNGKALNLTINSSKGLNKIPAKPKQFLLALLKKIDKSLELVVGEAPAETAPKEEEAKKALKVSPAQLQAFKAARKEEFVEINNAVKALKQSLKSVQSKVAANIKKGTVGSADVKVIQTSISDFKTLTAAYNNSHKAVKSKFAPAYNSLKKREQELAKLAMVVKKRKTSAAQRLADHYYTKTAQRQATEAEINEVQVLLKATIVHNRKSTYKTNINKLLKVTSFVLSKVGPKQFNPVFTDKVLEKLAA